MDESKKRNRLSVAQPAFRIWLCGAFRVERHTGNTYEVVRTPDWGGSSYPRLLLKALLCCPGRQARREALLDMLWPEAGSEQAAQNLNTATTKLRKVLQSMKGQESLLLTENDCKLYLLEGQQVLWADVDEALVLLNEAEQCGRLSPEALCLLEEAVNYFNNGPLLQDEEGYWVTGRRATVERAGYRCRMWLAEASIQQSRLGQAESILNTLLEEDPTDEDVLCRLMALLHQQGMTHQALRLYDHSCEVFVKEGVEISEATKQLASGFSQSDARISVTKSFLSQESRQNKASSLLSQPLLHDIIDGETLLSAAWFGQKQARVFAIIMAWREQRLLYDLLQVYIDQEMKGFETMVRQHPDGAEYEISRRQALITIAALPASLFSWRAPGPLSDLAMDELLPQCAASIIACWHLLRGKGFAMVEEILPQYVPILMAIALHPSKYQLGAARLATQAKILQAVLAMHRLNSAGREMHCHEAIRCARISDDCRLLAASLMYLGYTYSYCCRPLRPEKALPVFLEALAVLGDEDSLLRSDICMGLADAYAQCKGETQALHYMELAQNHFPAYPEQDPSFFYADCGLDTLYQWEGRMCLDLAEHYPDNRYQQRAWDALLKSTTVPALTERAANETIIYRADAARLLGDLPVYCDCLLEGTQLATALGSQKRYDEALEVFQRTPERWWREQRVLLLARDVFRQLPGGRSLG